MGTFIDELVKNKKERRKKVLERALSKKDPSELTYLNARTTKQKHAPNSKRFSVDMAQQIYHIDAHAEKSRKNRDRGSSSSLIPQAQSRPQSSTLSTKSNNSPIQIESHVDPIMFDEQKETQIGKRESVDMAKQIHQPSNFVDRPNTSRDSALISLVPTPTNYVDTSKVSKQSKKTPVYIEYPTEPFMTADRKSQQMKYMHSSVQDQDGVEYIKNTIEPPHKNIKINTDNLKKSDLSDPHSFQHISGYSKYQSEGRFDGSEIGSPLAMYEELPEIDRMKLPVGQQPKTIIEKKTHKEKNEKTGNVKKSDVSEPITLEHTSGFSKLGISVNNFDVDNFLRNQELRMQSGLIENKGGDSSTPNFINSSTTDCAGENVVNTNQKPTISTKIQITSQVNIPEELVQLDRLESRTKEENFEKTVELKTKKQNDKPVAPMNLKKYDVSDPFSFEHVSGYTKNFEEDTPGGLNVARIYGRLDEDIDDNEEGADRIIKKTHEEQLENVKALEPKKTKKQKTGKVKKSEISDPVNFEHVSGYTKLGDMSENDEFSDDDQLWSDDGGLTDDEMCNKPALAQNTMENNIVLKKTNEKNSGPVKTDKIKEKSRKDKKVIVKKGDLSGPLLIEHVSGFSKLGVSIENFDVDRYVENPELFMQSGESGSEGTSMREAGDEPTNKYEDNMNSLSTHDSDEMEMKSTHGKNTLLAQDTNSRAPKHTEANHHLKHTENIDVKEKQLSDSVYLSGYSKTLGNETTQLSVKAIENNADTDYRCIGEQSLSLESGNAIITGPRIFDEQKANDEKEKEVVKNDNFSDPVDFKHIGGFSKLGTCIESFKSNSYVEEQVKLSGKSGSKESAVKGVEKEIIKDHEVYSANDNRRPIHSSNSPSNHTEKTYLLAVERNFSEFTETKFQVKQIENIDGNKEPPQKENTKRMENLRKEELGDPVNFEHVFGYSKEVGSDSEEWSDEDIISAHSNILDYEDNTTNVDQSTSDNAHGQENEHGFETPPAYSNVPLLVSESIDRPTEENRDKESELVEINRGVVQLIPDKREIKSLPKKKLRKKKLRKEDIGLPQNLRHTYGHSTRDFGNGSKTFDRRMLEIDDEESLVQATNSETKGPKIRLFIQHLTPSCEELSENSGEYDTHSSYHQSLSPRRSVDSVCTSDTTEKQFLDATQLEISENESETTEIIDLQQSYNLHPLSSKNTEDVLQQIRQGPALKHVTLENTTTKVKKNVGDGSSAGPMALVLGKRYQAICPESSDSEYDDNISEGETCV